MFISLNSDFDDEVRELAKIHGETCAISTDDDLKSKIAAAISSGDKCFTLVGHGTKNAFNDCEMAEIALLITNPESEYYIPPEADELHVVACDVGLSQGDEPSGLDELRACLPPAYSHVKLRGITAKDKEKHYDSLTIVTDIDNGEENTNCYLLTQKQVEEKVIYESTQRDLVKELESKSSSSSEVGKQKTLDNEMLSGTDKSTLEKDESIFETIKEEYQQFLDKTFKLPGPKKLREILAQETCLIKFPDKESKEEASSKEVGKEDRASKKQKIAEDKGNVPPPHNALIGAAISNTDAASFSSESESDIEKGAGSKSGPSPK